MTEATSSALTPTLPPGPKRPQRIKYLRKRLADYYAMLAELREEYGDVVSWKMVGLDSIAIFDADMITEVLVEQRPYFPRALRLGAQCPSLPNPGLARSNFEGHQRKLGPVNALFREDRLPAYSEIMIRHFQEMVDSWQPGVVPAQDEIYRAVARYLGEAAVGRDLNPGHRVLMDAVKTIKWDFGVDFLPLKGLIRMLPLPNNRLLRRTFGKLDEVFAEALRKAREPGNERVDWISHLVRDSVEHPLDPPYTDQEMRDEVIDLILGGGVDPVAMVLAFTVGYLCRNPAAMDRLEQEVDEVLGDAPLTPEDYYRLPYARAVYHEGMRLAVPPFVIEREATEDRVVGGRYLVPKGTYVQLCRGHLFRDEKHFERANDFDPDRWMDGGPGCPANVYQPFNVEPRRCAAWQTTTMGGVFCLAAIARRFRMEPATDEPLEYHFTLLYGPKGPVPIRVTERGS